MRLIYLFGRNLEYSKLYAGINIKYLFMDFLKICICIYTGNVSHRIVNGQILIIFDKITTLFKSDIFSITFAMAGHHAVLWDALLRLFLHIIK